jgi:hypothetical protein
MPAKGGDAFPISYGDWDATNVRWSPDGKTLAFISNDDGNTQICFQRFEGGTQCSLNIERRVYLRSRVFLDIRVADDSGEQIDARVSVVDSEGKFYAPENSRIYADDGVDRQKYRFEAHYFYSGGALNVPPGKYTIDVSHGFEYSPAVRIIEVSAGKPTNVSVQLKASDWKAKTGSHWISADLHDHMNYGGTYLEDPNGLRDIAEAENLSIANNLIVNKEQRFPDIAYEGKGLDSASSNEVLILHGQEFHTSYWGHRGILGIKGHILLPGYAGYPNTAAASLFPMNADVYDMAHAQGAVVGAVHPFDEEPDPSSNPPQKITDELPVDVALGKLDYMEIVGFSDHKSTAAVWYRLLNLGFHLPAGAGTDATTNYAAPIRGQVGFDRVYAWVPEWPLTMELWLDALKKGRTFATNGPLVEFTLDGHRVGDELQYDSSQKTVPFSAKLRSIVPIDHLEIVCNGHVVQTLKLDVARESADATGTLPLNESGWCVLRAYSDKDEYPVLDKYPYATTSPVYVTIEGRPQHSSEDAKYFAAWIGRTIEVTSQYPDWNSPEEKEYVMKRLREAQAIFISKQ